MLTESRQVQRRSESKRNETLEALSNDIIRRLPSRSLICLLLNPIAAAYSLFQLPCLCCRFNIEAIQLKYPVSYTESMHTVLAQECLRYNRLVDVIRTSLQSLLKVHINQ
jgi:hypothetical protein